MVVFVVKRYAVREAEKWRYAIRKAKIGRYAVRKGGGKCHPHKGYVLRKHRLCGTIATSVLLKLFYQW